MARTPAELLVPGRPLTLAGVADGAEGLVVSDLARAVAAALTRRRPALLLCAATGHAWQPSRGRSASLPLDLVVEQFPAGTACPMTGSRRMPDSSPNA